MPENLFNHQLQGGTNMKDIVISDAVKYIGADDKDLDLFESQYIVPNGVSYNSYVILDEKIAVMDTIDTRKTIWRGCWMEEHRIIWLYLIWNRIMPEASKNLQINIRKPRSWQVQKLLQCFHSSLKSQIWQTVQLR